jgi:hypothetical protein
MEKQKKKKSRIRQTRTAWQKAFDRHPGMLQPFSWSDRLPEIIHISIALIENKYRTVKKDFYKIADYVNSKHKSQRKFHFNLSHTIKLIKQDKTILDEILKTCFKSAFEQLIPFYYYIFEIEFSRELKSNPKLLLLGYKQILDGRADTSILCKYLMAQYEQAGRDDPFNFFGWNSKKEILKLENVSKVMTIFPPSIGLSENLDLEFCQDIWMHNYYYSPPMLKPDDTKNEEEHFKEMKFEEFTHEFTQLYSIFKNINLLSVYSKLIAEINMGFAARISNLSLDVVELEKTHKGEIAELVFRTVLETFILGSYLLKSKDIELYKRFRDYSTGREQFMGEKILEQAQDNEVIKKEIKKMIASTIKEAGVIDIDVASERGDIFDLKIDQMADAVWDANNLYYLLYKRTSEVTHGNWKAIAKYHLAKSYNPTHNGLYWYNENPNRFAGLLPSFISLRISGIFLLTILDQIESPEINELKEKLTDFVNRIMESYMYYFNKYILPDDNKMKEVKL